MSAAAPCTAAGLRGQNYCSLQVIVLSRLRCGGLLSESDHNMHVLRRGSMRHCASRGSIILAGEVCGLRSMQHKPMIMLTALPICVT